jgi:hypothetical protein
LVVEGSIERSLAMASALSYDDAEFSDAGLPDICWVVSAGGTSKHASRRVASTEFRDVT